KRELANDVPSSRAGEPQWPMIRQCDSFVCCTSMLQLSRRNAGQKSAERHACLRVTKRCTACDDLTPRATQEQRIVQEGPGSPTGGRPWGVIGFPDCPPFGATSRIAANEL